MKKQNLISLYGRVPFTQIKFWFVFSKKLFIRDFEHTQGQGWSGFEVHWLWFQLTVDVIRKNNANTRRETE